MDLIRPIKEQDYTTLDLYWALSGQNVNARHLYPAESSYVYERQGKLLYGVAVYEIKGAPMAYVEAVIRDPYAKPDFEAIHALQMYIENVTKAKGYSTIMAFPVDLKLSKHYEKLGYNNVKAIQLMAKEI